MKQINILMGYPLDLLIALQTIMSRNTPTNLTQIIVRHKEVYLAIILSRNILQRIVPVEAGGHAMEINGFHKTQQMSRYTVTLMLMSHRTFLFNCRQ